jgi:hypothetical protein
LSIESEIARRIYDDVRESVLERKSVRLPLRIEEIQRAWPQASQDQILRAYLIAYELLILELAEALSKKNPAPLRRNVAKKRSTLDEASSED